MADTMNESNTDRKSRHRKPPRRLETIVEYIIRSHIEPLPRLTVEQLAKRFQINKNHLSRLFKSYLSVSMEEFIIKQKMIAAAIMMMSGNTKLTVEELSRKFGYPRYDYFSKCFKDFMAISPGGLMKIEKKRRNRVTVYEEALIKAGCKVSHLANVNYFLLEFVFVIHEDEAFRLIVYDRKENYYIDRTYKTLGKAKAGFGRSYRGRFMFGKYFTYWTPFCRPVRSWINSRNNILRSVPLKSQKRQKKEAILNDAIA